LIKHTGHKNNSLRGRRDRSRAQSFGLVEEKKPRARGFAARMAASPPKLRARENGGFALRRQNYARKYNSTSYAGYKNKGNDHQT